MRAEKPMVVDCDTCPVRHVRCDDCLVTAFKSLPLALLGSEAADASGMQRRQVEGELALDGSEQRAVAGFVAAGLVSPEQAATLTARREPWTRVAAAG